MNRTALLPLATLATAATLASAALAPSAAAVTDGPDGPDGPATAAPVVGHTVGGAPDAGTQRRTGAAAPVGSLVFVRDHDVWVARADGSGARPVTTDGTVRRAYGSPSQADDGTIAARHGHDIVRLTPNGRELSRFDPAPLLNSVSHPVDGVPIDVAISPDGRRVAYSFTGFECTNGCLERWATGVSRSDRQTDTDQHGTSFGNDPQWLGTDRLLLGGGGSSDVRVQDLGSDERLWFTDWETGSGDTFDFEDLEDPALSHDGRYVAAVRGVDDDTTIFWYTTAGDPRTDANPATPARRCTTGKLDGLASPVFSRDGRLALVYEDEIYMTTNPAVCEAPIDVVLSNAEEPSFSGWTYRAAVPASTARPVVRGTAVVGKTLTAAKGTWSGSPTSFAYRWLRDGRPIAGATRSTYRLVKADGGRKVSVTVTAGGAGGTAQATSTAVRVRAAR
ncbi:hypothetical protein GCM10023340_42570 [Nocardioides marinquilinus]|uniref:WD40 repeat protein n=1 Tax=Nocardioides marinquilinus TaxID=1210400 RepID=A0ABP9Q344_9ACTN